MNGCLYFPAPGPLLGPRPQALAPNLFLPALAPNLYLPTFAPTLCLSQICNYRLSPGLEFAYIDLVSPICIYWLWPTILYAHMLLSGFTHNDAE